MIGLMVILENMKWVSYGDENYSISKTSSVLKLRKRKSNVVENDSIPAVTQPTKEVK